MEEAQIEDAQSQVNLNLQPSNVSSDNAADQHTTNLRNLQCVMVDLQRMKRKKARMVLVEEERIAACREHLNKGIENKTTIPPIPASYRVPFDVECGFRTEHVGLEGLEADYNIYMTNQMTVEVPKGPTPSMLLEEEKAKEAAAKAGLESVFSYITVGLDGSLAYSRHCARAALLKESQTQPQEAASPISIKTKTCIHPTIQQDIPILRFDTPKHIQYRSGLQGETIPWFHDRVQLSSLPVRFGLPMDVRELRGMSIRRYLNKYCKIHKDRMLVYARFYKQHKPPKAKVMNTSELPRALNALLYECVPEEAINQLIHSLDILNKHESTVEFSTFSLIAAVAERILYLSYAEVAGPVAPGAIRSFTECADFDSLLWKLKDIHLQPALKLLLFSLG